VKIKFPCICLLPIFVLLNCGENNFDGGSTVGNGLLPLESSLVGGDIEGVVLLCKKGGAITKIAAVAIEEMKAQGLTLEAPNGSLSLATEAAADRITRFDSDRSASLKAQLATHVRSITYATQELSAVPLRPGASVESGCMLARAFQRRASLDRVLSDVVFAKDIWEAADVAQQVALMAELAVLEKWDETKTVNANQARALARYMMSKEILSASEESYNKYVADAEKLAK